MDETDGGSLPNMPVSQLPTMSDMLICYPTMAGKLRGTCFMEGRGDYFMEGGDCFSLGLLFALHEL